MSGKVVLLAGAAALMPPLAGQGIAQTASTVARPFVPPETPQVLTRTVWRTLADGKQIVVRRRYAIHFVRRGDGFEVDGKLLDAAVEAPPMLAGMAELERTRGDEGLFPMLLDAAGQMRAQATASSATGDRNDAALERAEALLSTRALPPGNRSNTSAFLSQLAAHGAAGTWPSDLFNPLSDDRHEHRRVTLPGGQEGEVSVEVKVLGRLPQGLPQAVERTVRTTMAGTSRSSREQWTLVPAARPDL